MNTATRLAAYGVGLVVVFGGAFVAADAVVPASTVRSWTEQAEGHDMDTSTAGHDDHGSSDSSASDVVAGVSSAQSGHLLSPVDAPAAVGRAGTLSFRILDAAGEAVRRFAISHEKELHLIVVRADGTEFRHVHPTVGADGTWSLPWSWSEAGTYRVFADFVPEAGAHAVTLTRTVDVAGGFTPVAPEPTRTATVGGYTAELRGEVAAGSGSELTFSVSKDGEPVTDLEPYLGAFGHLVALRHGDLAFLHVHPEDEEPAPGATAGPEIGFVAELPTPGRYLLYLDFQVGGTVHSAPFVVDATGTATGKDGGSQSPHPDTQAPTDRERDRDADAGTGSGGGHGHAH